MSFRMEKVNKEIKRQITKIIQEELDDPTVGLLSITRVDTTSDLKECRVYFSLLNDTQYEHVQETLDKMNKFIRFNLGKRVRIRILPELKFIPDDSIKYSIDMYQKIEEVIKDDNAKPGADGEKKKDV